MAVTTARKYHSGLLGPDKHLTSPEMSLPYSDAAVAEPVEVRFRPRPLLYDPNDEIVIEAASNGRADAIVTHNVKDLRIGADPWYRHRYTGRNSQETKTMSGSARSKYPLHLPASLKEAAARLARNDGVSLNQWITAAVAQKVGAVETANELLARRAAQANPGDLTRYLDAAPDVPPEPGDEVRG